MKEITLKMNGRNPKKVDYQGASYLGRTDERTDGRTDGHTILFLPFPKTKPLVPRGKKKIAHIEREDVKKTHFTFFSGKELSLNSTTKTFSKGVCFFFSW